MKLYRIAKKKFINDFSGEGAKLYGGRWNKRGTHMLYFSTSLSLCVLEILVHFNQDQAPEDLYFAEVELSNQHINQDGDFIAITPHLRDNPPHYSTQLFGSNWVEANKDLALLVPSAILPVESNVIVNPKHHLCSKLKTIRVLKLELDSRVLL